MPKLRCIEYDRKAILPTRMQRVGPARSAPWPTLRQPIRCEAGRWVTRLGR